MSHLRRGSAETAECRFRPVGNRFIGDGDWNRTSKLRSVKTLRLPTASTLDL